MHRMLGRAALAAAFLQAAEAARAADPTLRLDLGGGVRLELVLVQPGAFAQGSPPDEVGRGDDEVPREVTLQRSFYVGRFEVTRGQFARFTEETGYRTEAEKGSSGGFGWDGGGLVQRREFTWRSPGFTQTDDHPVVLVTYDDALAFTVWLSRRVRRAVTLPTEAQWEYAARGGSSSRFPGASSDEEARTLGWFKANAGDGTRPVGQKRPNAFGVHDTVGNAYEWCRDWYGPYVPGPVSDPEETRSTLSEKPRRVLRGGSWLKDAKACRSAARYRNAPGSRNGDNGFRVASIDGAAHAAPAAAPPGTAAPATRETSPEAGAGPLALLLGFIGCGSLGILLLIVVAVRRLRRSSGRGADSSVTAIPVADGFWLRSPKAKPGQIIRCRATVGGVTEERDVQAEAGLAGRGQFVYTGGRPTAVEVLGVHGAGVAAAETAARAHERRRDEDQPEDSTPFGGYPSAY